MRNIEVPGLLPCPFCGAPAQAQAKMSPGRWPSEKAYRIVCGNVDCGVFPTTGTFPTIGFVKDAWNKRA